MSDHLAGRGRRADPRRGLRLAALTAVTTGVVLLAIAAFLLSYGGIQRIAHKAGVTAPLASLYPLIFDAMLVIACAAILALRGAGWFSKLYVWFSLLILLAAVASADAVHAMKIALPQQPSRAAVAVTPWALLLLGFGLWLVLLRHVRRVWTAYAQQDSQSLVPSASVTAANAGESGTSSRSGRKARAGARQDRQAGRSARTAADHAATEGWATGAGAPARAGAGAAARTSRGDDGAASVRDGAASAGDDAASARDGAASARDGAASAGDGAASGSAGPGRLGASRQSAGTTGPGTAPAGAGSGPGQRGHYGGGPHSDYGGDAGTPSGSDSALPAGPSEQAPRGGSAETGVFGETSHDGDFADGGEYRKPADTGAEAEPPGPELAEAEPPGPELAEAEPAAYHSAPPGEQQPAAGKQADDAAERGSTESVQFQRMRSSPTPPEEWGEEWGTERT